MDINEIGNTAFENKGKLKRIEVRLKALINILTKEGVTTTEEVEAEFKDLLDKNEKK